MLFYKKTLKRPKMRKNHVVKHLFLLQKGTK